MKKDFTKEEYLEIFKELNIDKNPLYLRNDVGINRLFFDIHRKIIAFICEHEKWFAFDEKIWASIGGNMKVVELCKQFFKAYAAHAANVQGSAFDGQNFVDYANEFHYRRRREALIKDSQSIGYKRINDFDSNPLLLNCQNGVYDFKDKVFRPHDPSDFLTKITRADYVEGTICERWLRFIDEVMSGDKAKAHFLQKALGYALSGQTHLECFFVLFGATTRNGKSTLTETVAHLLNDYALTMQPQSLARRTSHGSYPTPDIARLKGARFVTMPEPPKDLEIDGALLKQLTGSDSVSGRLVFHNSIEFRPDFKLFMNTNHLPRIADDTIVTSGRLKIIPFERHFLPHEQDKHLKRVFREPLNLSGILNWLIEGYIMLEAEGLEETAQMKAVIEECREITAAADIDSFFDESLAPSETNRLKTSALYERYTVWMKKQDMKPLTTQKFVGELRERYEVKKDSKLGNVIVGFDLK